MACPISVLQLSSSPVFFLANARKSCTASIDSLSPGACIGVFKVTPDKNRSKR